MVYVRKTRDEYDIEGDCGCGWECLTTETTRKEALQQLRTYRENDPRYPYRIRKRRVPREPQ